jgi:hypothetical protein
LRICPVVGDHLGAIHGLRDSKYGMGKPPVAQETSVVIYPFGIRRHNC